MINKIKNILFFLIAIFIFVGCTPVATIPDDWIDHSSNSVKMIDETHAKIHEGKHCKFEDYRILSSSETKYFLLYTDGKEFHFNYYFSFESGEGEFIIYENPTFDNVGILLNNVFNSNRNSNISTVGVLYEDPSITNEGTQLFRMRLGAKRTSGEISRGDNEIILKNNTYYLIKIVNHITSNNIVNLRFVGYEN